MWRVFSFRPTPCEATIFTEVLTKVIRHCDPHCPDQTWYSELPEMGLEKLLDFGS